MNEADFIIIAVIIMSAFIGLLQGLVTEVLSLISWLVSFTIACLFVEELAHVLHPFIHYMDLSLALSFFILLIFSLVIGIGLNYLILKSLCLRALSYVEQFIGMILGGLRGMVLISFLVLVAGLSPKIPTLQWWQHSIYIQSYFQPIAIILHRQLPSNMIKEFHFPSTMQFRSLSP